MMYTHYGNLILGLAPTHQQLDNISDITIWSPYMTAKRLLMGGGRTQLWTLNPKFLNPKL